MRKRANSVKHVDGFSAGIIDFVTDRTRSVYLGSFSAALVPAVIVSICTVYFLEKPTNEWLDAVPAYMDVMSYPSSLVIAVPCCEGTFRLLVSNNARLPIDRTMVNVTLLQFKPDIEYSFCQNLIYGTLREERLRSVCTPLIYSQECFTNANGFVDIENMSVVAGVPGMYVLQVTAHQSITGRNSQGVLGTVYIGAVSRNFSIRVVRNAAIDIIPSAVAPDTIVFGEPLTRVGPYCAPSNNAVLDCGFGARPDLAAPAATLVYSGNGTLSPGITMAFFLVAHMEEVLQPDAEFPRTANPHAAGSRLRMARMADDTGANSLARPVPADGGPVQFTGLKVLASNNPSLVFAFHVCGTFALWNRNWLGDDGLLQVQEVLALPPNGSKGERAALGDFWMGAQVKLKNRNQVLFVLTSSGTLTITVDRLSV